MNDASSPIHGLIAAIEGQHHSHPAGEPRDRWHMRCFVSPEPHSPTQDTPKPALSLWLQKRKTSRKPSVTEGSYWVAIPIGRPQDSDVEPDLSDADRSALLASLSDFFLPAIDRLSADPVLIQPLQSELETLCSKIATSRLAQWDGLWWWLVPCSEWQLASPLLADHGPPTLELQRDWHHQWPTGFGPPCATLISPHGLLASLDRGLSQLSTRLKLLPVASTQSIATDLQIEPETSEWGFELATTNAEADNDPAIATPMEDPSPVNTALVSALQQSAPRTAIRIAQPPSPGRPQTRIRIAVAALAIGFLAIVVFSSSRFASSLEQPLADGPARVDATSPAIHATASNLTSSNLTTGEDTAGEDTAGEDAAGEDAADTAIVLQSTPLGDPSVLQPEIDLETMIQSSLGRGVGVDSLLGSSPQTQDDEPSIEIFERMDAPKFETFDDPVPNENTDLVTRVERLALELATGSHRRDIKFGPGVAASRAFCVATLRVGTNDTAHTNDPDGTVSDSNDPPALDDVDWSVSPSEPQQVVGTGMCEWRIGLEDADPELILRLWSKPDRKWQLAMLVGVRMSPSAEPMQIALKDPTIVLQRLSAHQIWLTNTIANLRAAPQIPARRGFPDSASQLRWMQAQQKETQAAIKTWQVIAKLCDECLYTAQVEIELSSPSTRSAEDPKVE